MPAICVEQTTPPMRGTNSKLTALYKYKLRTKRCGAFALDIFLRFAIIKIEKGAATSGYDPNE